MIVLQGFIELARDYIVLMAVLNLAGGIMGYVKASSKASLIAGTISALVLAVCFFVSINGKLGEALIGSFIAYAILDVVFAMRLFKTKKFMPAGMLLIMCTIGMVMSMIAVFQVAASSDYRG